MQNFLPLSRLKLHREIITNVCQYSRFRTTKPLPKKSPTYYDILQVRTDCTSKEIRDAFVFLSKKFHPDVKTGSQNPSEASRFVQISEAYQTLSKPRLRNAYDQRLWTLGRLGPDSAYTGEKGLTRTDQYEPWEIRPNYDPNPGAYYGVKGVEKVSNSKVLWSVLGFALVGAIVSFLSVKKSVTLNRQKLDEKSAEAGMMHAAVRADAEKHGNQEQLRRMVDRMARDPR